MSDSNFFFFLPTNVYESGKIIYCEVNGDGGSGKVINDLFVRKMATTLKGTIVLQSILVPPQA